MTARRRRPRIAFVFTHRIQYFVNVLDELAARGVVEPVAVYGRATEEMLDPGFLRRIDWDNRRERRFQEIVLPRGWRSLLSAVLLPGGDDDVLARLAPDVVHLNGYAHPVQVLAHLWAARCDIPTWIRGDGDVVKPGLSAGALLARPIVRRASAVLYQGRQNKEYWSARGAMDEQLVWIPCVADSQVFRAEAFSSPAARDAFRATLGAAPGDLVIVVSGKLESRKRPADVLEALHGLPSRFRLWFLGSGPLEQALIKRAEELRLGDRVNWLGFRNQKELPRVLNAADVLVHASERDPWPYSVLEGATCGLPLILSSAVGSVDEWQGAQAALVFPAGDPEALRRCLAEILDANRRTGLSRNARLESERYTEDVFCGEIEALLNCASDGLGALSCS